MTDTMAALPPWETDTHDPVFLKEVIRRTADALFAQIASGQYSYGARLQSERQLAAEFGLSRDGIRQVIDFLEDFGVVLRRANIGTFVTYRTSAAQPKTTISNDTSDTGVLDISKIVDEASPIEFSIVRSIVEPEMVRLAAMYMSANDIRKLTLIMAEINAIVTEGTQFVDEERKFMRAIAEGTHNPILSAMYQVIDVVRDDTAFKLNRIKLMTPARIADSKNKLRSLYEALIARDIETSVEFMKLIVADENNTMIARG